MSNFNGKSCMVWYLMITEQLFHQGKLASVVHRSALTYEYARRILLGFFELKKMLHSSVECMQGHCRMHIGIGPPPFQVVVGEPKSESWPIRSPLHKSTACKSRYVAQQDALSNSFISPSMLGVWCNCAPCITSPIAPTIAKAQQICKIFGRDCNDC